MKRIALTSFNRCGQQQKSYIVGVFFVVLVCGVIYSTWANASTFKNEVAFAGITFQGGLKERQVLYPFSSQLVEEQKLSVKLLKRFDEKQPLNFTLTGNKLDNDSGYKYAIAFMIDGEYSFVEKSVIAKQVNYRAITTISAQAVIFDITSSQFVSAIPLLPIEIRRDFNHQPQQQEIKELFSEILTEDNDQRPSLITQFYKQTLTANAPSKANVVQLAVNKVTVENKAQQFLPDHFKGNNNAAFKRYVAQQLLKNIAVNWGIATQPFVTDTSIVKMQSRFTGKDLTFDIKLPKPIYSIDYTVRGFKYMTFDKNDLGESRVYSSFSHFSVRQNAGSGSDIFSHRLKTGATKLILASHSEVDDWAAFRESLLSLFQKTATSLHDQRSEFLKAQKFNKSAIKALKQLEEIYQKCKL